jgi:hypothetical protein
LAAHLKNRWEEQNLQTFRKFEMKFRNLETNLVKKDKHDNQLVEDKEYLKSLWIDKKKEQNFTERRKNRPRSRML